VGRPQLTEHRDSRGCIRRGDDSAERDGGGPRDLGHQPADCDRHGCDGERDGDQRQARHRSPVLAEIAGRRVEGCIQEHRRDEERQRQLGIEGDCGSPRYQCEPGSGERQKGRVGKPRPPRQRGKRRPSQEKCDNQLEELHALISRH
jgi:hypothetical protein